MIDWAQTVETTPQLKRGKVWCRKCGHSQRVNSARCLSNGWPKCCGYTMTLDSPTERAKGEGEKKIPSSKELGWWCDCGKTFVPMAEKAKEAPSASQ